MQSGEAAQRKPSWRPAAVALLVFALLVVVVAPLMFEAGDSIEGFFNLRFAGWALREAPVPAPRGLGSLLVEIVLIPTALLLGVLQERGLDGGLRLRLPRARAFVWVALVLVPLSVDASLDSVQRLFTWWPVPPNADSPPDARFIPMLTAVVLAPIGEELFFRGVLQTAVSRRWGAPAAITVGAIAFSVWHQDPAGAHVLLLAGLGYAWVTERCNSIVPAIFAHSINNLFGQACGSTVLSVSRTVHAATLLVSIVSLMLAIAALTTDGRASKGTTPAPPSAV